MRFVSSRVALGAHGHIFRSDAVLFHWRNSLRWHAEKVEDVEADSGRSKKAFCMFLEEKSRLPATKKAPGCTTLVLAIQYFSTHPCQKPTPVSGEEV